MQKSRSFGKSVHSYFKGRRRGGGGGQTLYLGVYCDGTFPNPPRVGEVVEGVLALVPIHVAILGVGVTPNHLPDVGPPLSSLFPSTIRG